MIAATITVWINAESSDEAWAVLDGWVGLTAPESVDSFNLHVHEGDPPDDLTPSV